MKYVKLVLVLTLVLLISACQKEISSPVSVNEESEIIFAGFTEEVNEAAYDVILADEIETMRFMTKRQLGDGTWLSEDEDRLKLDIGKYDHFTMTIKAQEMEADDNEIMYMIRLEDGDSVIASIGLSQRMAEEDISKTGVSTSEFRQEDLAVKKGNEVVMARNMYAVYDENGETEVFAPSLDDYENSEETNADYATVLIVIFE